jgi:Cu/Ag efflux pump CusA
MAPLVIAQGLGPTFFRPLALAYGAAVLAAMLVTLTVTPALGVLLFERPPRRRVGAALGARIRRAYAALLSRTVRAPAALLLVLGALGLAGLVVVPFLEEPDRPSFRDRDVLVRTDATPSTSLPEMDRIARRTADELRSLPGIDGVAVAVGRAVNSDRPVGANSSETWVRIAGGADYAKTLARIRQVAEGTPGVHSAVTTYEDDRSAGVLEGPTSALDVRVYGNDYGVLRRNAAKVAAVVGRVPGVRNPKLVGLPTEQPTLDVKVNLTAALRHGIKPGDVRRALATLTSGLTVGNFFEKQKVFEVVVRGVPAASRSADSVRGLLIDTPAGGTVRLRDIATIRVAASPTNIRHDATKRFLDVQADTQGGDIGSIRSDIERRLRGVAFPFEYHAELLSTSGSGAPAAVAEGGTPRGRFVVFLIAAEIAVLLLLQAAFGNWALAFVVFLTVPLATVGGLVAAIVAGTLNELGAMVGLLVVVGLTLRPAIALITRVQAAQRRSGAVPGRELTMRVALDQFAPTAMAAVATAVALLPFALASDAAGNEITQPMAVVILGGLVTAMAVNLLVVPAISLAFGAAIPMGTAPIEPEADGQSKGPPSAPRVTVEA